MRGGIHLHLQDDSALHKVMAGKTGVDHLAHLVVHIAAVPNATASGLPGVRIGIIDGDSFVAFALTMREFLSAARAFEVRYGEQLGMQKPSDTELAQTLPFRVGMACILAQTAHAKVPKGELATFIGEVALTVIETGKLPT